MVTAEDILREAEEALEKEKEPSPALNPAEQILAEAEDVLEQERMALPPVVAEKRTVAIPLTESAKGVTPPPLPNIDKAVKPMAQLGGLTAAYVPPKSYAPAPKPEPQKPEEAANQDAAYMEYAGMVPKKPEVTADEMFKGAEFRAPDQGVMAWLLGEEKAPLKSPKIIGEAPKEEPAPTEKIPTQQPDIFLYLVREKQGFDLSPQEQEMLNSLNPEELSQVKNQREDIIFSEDLDRKVFEYRRPTGATVPRDGASWLNIFPAAAELAGTAASSVVDFGLSAATGGVEATVGYMNAFASGTDQGLANQLIFQLPEDRQKVIQEKIRAAELDPAYSGDKLLEIVLQEYSPEQREEILKKKENIVQTAKAILPAYVSSAVDKPYQVAAVGQKVKAGGIEAFDLLNETMPWGSREKSFQNF
jgi:vacuolar-type H+-ATPase subunit H